ncbi:MAG: restriction endonuclease subunit S [Methyloprofundus sp.]|nr:restriction endonuclease subunit S [Methyloprofundus sp.]
MSELPKGWIETTLGEVATFQRGFDLPKKDRTSGQYPLMVSNGQDGTHKDYKIKAPGVVTGRSGTLGSVFYVKENFWALNTTLWVKDFHGNNKRFIYYFLKRFPFDKYNSGSGVPTLNRNHIHPILVKIPPLPEQNAINNILSVFDEKIELLREQNETLETLAQTIFKEWFVNFNFPEATGEIVDSELGDIPKGWKVGKLGDIAFVKSGYAFKSKDFVDVSNNKTLKIKDLKGSGKIDLSNVSNIVDSITNLDRVRYFKLEVGDIVFAMSGNTTGKIGIVPESNLNIYLNQRVGKFFIKENTYTNFLYVFLISQNYEEKILNMGYGSAQPNVSPSQIESIDIIFPDKNTFNKFIEAINKVFEKIKNNTSQIQTLAKTRDTLLPKLMSGEIRVKGFEK